LVAEAALRFAPLQLAVDARLASGAPARFEEAALAGLHAISRVEAGRVEVTDQTVQVTGVALYAGAVRRIEQQLENALPAGFVLVTNFSVKPAESTVAPAECQQMLNDVVGSGGIGFTESSATIAPASEGRLDRIVAILSRCPAARIEIGAYTDSAGTAARNQALSEIRAASVLEYMVGAGVASDRLVAVGYGELDPIASNDTEDGRTRNRRIEFKILEL
jgi:OOP family OmpA-OmpF porin